MKLYVFNVRRMIIYMLILTTSILTISVLSLSESGEIAVFSVQKEIPIYSVDVSDNIASITFDCAWGADDIPDILKTLKEADVRATFFMVGQWAEKNDDVVGMIARDGHDIANHSLSHFRMGTLGRDKVAMEIEQCGELLERLSGAKCELFRAPYGDYNNTVVTEAKRLGYYMIQWNVDSLDWKPGIGKKEIMQRIRTKIRPGSIVLFHNDTPHTAKLLPEIISELKAGGYDLVPVSELIIRENYFIDHEGRQKNNT